MKKPLINHKNTEDNKEKTMSAKERFLDYDQRAKKKTWKEKTRENRTKPERMKRKKKSSYSEVMVFQYYLYIRGG